jgi:hypothetical protein
VFSDHCLQVFGLQGRKSGKNFFDGIASRQAGQHCAKRNPSAPKNRLAAASLRVPYDPVFVFNSGYPFPKLRGRLLSQDHTIDVRAHSFGIEGGSRGIAERSVEPRPSKLGRRTLESKMNPIVRATRPAEVLILCAK